MISEWKFRMVEIETFLLCLFKKEDGLAKEVYGIMQAGVAKDMLLPYLHGKS